MATRLNMILAHLRALPLDVSASLVVAKLMNAGYSGASGRETKLKIDTLEMDEALARKVVYRLATTIREPISVAGPPFRAAYDRAVGAAEKIEGFTREHPVWTIVIVLCILAIMYPTSIKALGFGMKGPIEGQGIRPTHGP